jgi:hypothetical protein
MSGWGIMFLAIFLPIAILAPRIRDSPAAGHAFDEADVADWGRMMIKVLSVVLFCLWLYGARKCVAAWRWFLAKFYRSIQAEAVRKSDFAWKPFLRDGLVASCFFSLEILAFYEINAMAEQAALRDFMSNGTSLVRATLSSGERSWIAVFFGSAIGFVLARSLYAPSGKHRLPLLIE